MHGLTKHHSSADSYLSGFFNFLDIMNIKNLMQQLNQRPIAVYPAYIDITGSVNAGLLLSQLMYWYSVVNRKFYKTDEDIMAETRLSIRELKTAKAKLKSLPFIHVKAEGVPARTFYDIDMDLMAEYLANAPNKFVQNVPTEKYKTSKLKSTKRTNLQVQNVPTITENTHKNTSKNTSDTFSENEFSPAYSNFNGIEIIDAEHYDLNTQNTTPPVLRGTPPAGDKTNVYLMYEAYCKFMEQKGYPISKNATGNSYRMQPKDAKALKDWAAWAEGMPGAGTAVDDWTQFVQAAWATGDKWLKSNFTVSVLCSQKDRVIINANKAKQNELDIDAIINADPDEDPMAKYFR